MSTVHPRRLLELLPKGILRPAYCRRLAQLEETLSAFMVFGGCRGAELGARPQHMIGKPDLEISGFGEERPLGGRTVFLSIEPQEAPQKCFPAQLEGRFTMASVAGYSVPVLTEADNRPNFTVTTSMTHHGRAIRKIESSWGHPLDRREDLVLAQRLIALQHEHAGDFALRAPEAVVQQERDKLAGLTETANKLRNQM